jgi:hypothetical protein
MIRLTRPRILAVALTSLLISGCASTPYTVEEMRQFPMGPSHIVHVNYEKLARYWDCSQITAPGPDFVLRVAVKTFPDTQLVRIELRSNFLKRLRGFIEIKGSDVNDSVVTAFARNGTDKTLADWEAEIVNATPGATDSIGTSTH